MTAEREGLDAGDEGFFRTLRVLEEAVAAEAEAEEVDEEDEGGPDGEERPEGARARVRWSAWNGLSRSAQYGITGTVGVDGFGYRLEKIRRVPAGTPVPLGAEAEPVSPWNTVEVDQVDESSQCRSCRADFYMPHTDDCEEWRKVQAEGARWVDLRTVVGAGFESVQRAKDDAEKDAAADEAPQGRLF
jgi:hypothetical protein